MRIDLKLSVAGDTKKKPFRRPLTSEHFLAVIDHLMVSELIKERLRELVHVTPSTALRNVMDHLNDYLNRYEQEIKEDDEKYYTRPASQDKSQGR